MSTTITVLGQQMRPLETVERVRVALGLKKTKAFALADEWPSVGEKPGRLIIVPALMDRLGIPYEVHVDAPEDPEPEVDAS